MAETPTVDVQNARQVAAFEGETIRELPTTRNIRSILTLTPGRRRRKPRGNRLFVLAKGPVPSVNARDIASSAARARGPSSPYLPESAVVRATRPSTNVSFCARQGVERTAARWRRSR